MSDEVGSITDEEQGEDQNVENESAEEQANVGPAPKGITTDDKQRYLVEIVANDGLSKAAKNIADEIKQYSGILIVDDLEFAINDIFYRDIQKKLKTLKELVKNESDQCENLWNELTRQDEESQSMAESIELFSRKVINDYAENKVVEVPFILGKTFGFSDIIKSVTESATGIGGAATAISGSLEAIGTIIGYFRSAYDIKGQSLVSIDEIYVQAMVAKHLSEKNVHLLNFNLIKTSELLSDLDELMRTHLNLLTCLEKISPDAIETQVEALSKYLVGLQSKYSEALIKIDEKALADLEDEIHKSEQRLSQYRKNRIPDGQVAALETHLGELRDKFVDAIASDVGSAEAAVRTEISNATTELQNPNLPQAKIDELIAHRKNLLTELARIVVSKNSKITSNLETKIVNVERKLAGYRQNRYPDSLIEAEEKHLANLRTKQAELKAINDNDARNALKMEIEKVENQINARQLHINKANRIIHSGKKLSDAIDTFIEKITTVPEGGEYPPLVIACIRECLADETKGINYLLKLKLISAGAELITQKKWGFWNLPDLGYLGGGVVSFILAEASGKIVASDTVYGISKMVHKIGKAPKFLNYEIG